MSDPLYGAPTPELPAPVAVIDGHSGRKLNNALTLTLVEGSPGAEPAPFAKAQQGAGDGMGKRLGILFGFKNYGQGDHVLTYLTGTLAGSTLVVATRDRAPTVVTRGDGTAVATITRAETSTATLPDGTELLRFVPDPVSPVEDSRYRILVTTPDAVPLATLDLIRTAEGFDALGLAELVLAGGIDTDTGGSLPNLFHGTRLVLYREPTPLQREVLLAVCVDLGIAARPYFTAMGKVVAWG